MKCSAFWNSVKERRREERRGQVRQGCGREKREKETDCEKEREKKERNILSARPSICPRFRPEKRKRAVHSLQRVSLTKLAYAKLRASGHHGISGMPFGSRYTEKN